MSAPRTASAASVSVLAWNTAKSAPSSSAASRSNCSSAKAWSVMTMRMSGTDLPGEPAGGEIVDELADPERPPSGFLRVVDPVRQGAEAGTGDADDIAEVMGESHSGAAAVVGGREQGAGVE